MGIIEKSLRVYRVAVLVDTLAVAMSIAFAYYLSIWFTLPMAYFVMALGMNIHSWVKLHKVSKSPFAYLIEVEALCNGGKLKEE